MSSKLTQMFPGLQARLQSLTKRATEQSSEATDTTLMVVQSEAPQQDQSLVEFLVKGFSTEIQSWYMYLAASNNLRGESRLDLLPELTKHAAEELEHANWYAQLLIIRGGYVPEDLTQLQSKAANEAPSVRGTGIPEILDVLERSEQEAIDLCEQGLETYKDDKVVSRYLKKILTTEQEHLFDVKVNFKGQTI